MYPETSLPRPESVCGPEPGAAAGVTAAASAGSATRKLTAKGLATKARIVDAATVLVGEHGVAGTSIDDVRKAAGVSGSQLSHYFDDKAALVEAVVARQTSGVLDAQAEMFPRLDSLELLRDWADWAIGYQQAEGFCGCPVGSLAGELAGDDTAARAELAAGFDRWGVVLEDGLTAMRDRGDLPPDADPRSLALGLLAALQGGLLLTRTMQSTAPLEASMAASLAHLASLAGAKTAR